MKDIREIAKCLDPMIEKLDEHDLKKSISFNPLSIKTMTAASPYYNPYRMVDGGFVPHPAEYWYSTGKPRGSYQEVEQYYRDAGASGKDFGCEISGDFGFGALRKSVTDLIKVKKAELPQDIPGVEEITRNAFLYMEPKEEKNKDQFAQCSRCMMWTGPDRKTCTIHGKNVQVTGDMSCAIYVQGDPMPEQAGHEVESVNPEESGLVRTAVRCENCVYFKPKTNNECNFFHQLNKKLPKVFDLKEKVSPKGCCNAFIPIPDQEDIRKAADKGTVHQYNDGHKYKKTSDKHWSPVMGKHGFGLKDQNSKSHKTLDDHYDKVTKVKGHMDRAKGREFLKEEVMGVVKDVLSKFYFYNGEMPKKMKEYLENYGESEKK